MLLSKGWLPGLFLAAASCGAQASSVTVLSSYDQDGDTETSWGVPFSSAQWESFTFRTGANQNYSLDSLTMRLAGERAGAVQVDVFVQDRRFDPKCGTGVDGTLIGCTRISLGEHLGTLTNASVGALADYQFSASQPIALAKDSAYWVVFMAIDAGDTFRYYERKYTPLPGQGWTSLFWSETGAAPIDFYSSPYPLYCLTQPSAGGMCAPAQPGSRWIAHSGLNLYSITGTASPVPEPGTGVLWASAIAVFCLLRSRRSGAAFTV
ncbi:MAG: hypothetical protein EON59_03520 [Alphaproteobacteria bacterium]|nr:MAG: hypothetical protein EON59_03520 [Alphaproteobacteria bacterium]